MSENSKGEGPYDTVHVIPLGHEIDRAVVPFMLNKIDRAYILAIPEDADLDQRMKDKQQCFLSEVIKKLENFGIRVKFVPVNMFEILDVLKVTSFIVREEKALGNMVHVNMSSCGRKTSIAASLAAMYHQVRVYYVSADRYAVSPEEEKEHGLSVVETVKKPETLQNFQIMKLKDASVQLLVELYNRKELGIDGMTSEEIIQFFHNQDVYGYEIKNLHSEERDAYKASKKRRALLNRTNQGYLKNLEENEYVERKWKGREFSIHILKAGEHIACVSGLIGDSEMVQW